MSDIIFHSQLVQAPLAGYSCSAMRRLTSHWGKVDFCYSEMLSAKHLRINTKNKPRYMHIAPDEPPVCIQISGDNADDLAYASDAISHWGAQYIDLNCGCPMPKIRKKRCGSALLSNSKHLYQLVKSIKDHTHLPVIIKIRVDADSGDQYNLDAAKAIEDAGASAISVHGRHWTHRYDTPVYYGDITQIKQHVSIPVIGNGDINDGHSAQMMFQKTGCDAVMIARAAVGQPWLFAEIDAIRQGKSFTPPDKRTIGDIFIQHLKHLMTLEIETTVLLQARQLAKYYARDDKERILQQAIIQCKNIAMVTDAIDHHFQSSSA